MAIHNPAGPTFSEPVTLSGARRLVVAFHGLAPHTQRPCQELLMLLSEVGVPRASLLVVPRCQGAGSILERPFFLRWLRDLSEAGHEVCLLGEGAPAPGMAEEKILAEAGLPARGFVAPGHTLSAGDRAALRGRGFDYAVSGRSLHLLGDGIRLDAPVVAFSHPLAGRARFATSRRHPLLRVAVHPNDLYEHRPRRTLIALLARALADREAATYGELVRAAAPSHI